MPMSERQHDRFARRALLGLSAAFTVVALTGIAALLFDGSEAEVPTVMYAHINGERVDGDWSADLRATADAFAARPLFHASRRPWQPAAPAPQPGPAATTAPRLMGIVGAGNTYLALMIHGSGQPARSIHAGGRIGPWQVLAVGPQHVDLASERGEELTLRLKRAD